MSTWPTNIVSTVTTQPPSQNRRQNYFALLLPHEGPLLRPFSAPQVGQASKKKRKCAQFDTSGDVGNPCSAHPKEPYARTTCKNEYHLKRTPRATIMKAQAITTTLDERVKAFEILFRICPNSTTGQSRLRWNDSCFIVTIFCPFHLELKT